MLCARAAAGGHLKCVHVLLQYAADPGLRDEAGRTALDYAKAQEHKEVTRPPRRHQPATIASPSPPAPQGRPAAPRPRPPIAMAELPCCAIGGRRADAAEHDDVSRADARHAERVRTV